jgi:hypothetical protein
MKSPNGNDWELKIQKNGVTVYTKSVPGNSVKAVKSVYTLKSSLSALVALVEDVPAYHNWIYHCSHAEILKNEGPAHLIYYQETSVPWPASNRDFIGNLKISQDKKTKIVTVNVDNQPDFIPEKSGKVRLKKFIEKIVIVPKGNGEVELTYELLLDPGGNIPSWMINLAITEGPYETSLEMIKTIQSGTYKNAHFDFIKD